MRLQTFAVAAALIASAGPAAAQHAAFRIKGRVVTDTGAPVANVEVRTEAFYGYGAGTFAGQRTFSSRTDAKGAWSIGALQPGIWLFVVVAPGYLPETVVIPPRLLTTVSQGTSGMSMTWDLIMKPVAVPDGGEWLTLKAAADAAAEGKADVARSALQAVPPDANADYLAAAGRVALVAGDLSTATTLFKRALERDPSSYRAALGIASMMLLSRDFDAARSRTRDKDEQRFISAAIGELAAIKYR